MSKAFNDSTKHEDISKMIVLTSHNILQRTIDKLLLQICRCYQELSLYVTMKLQAEDRIRSGEEVFKRFGCLLKAYIDKSSRIPGLDEKNYNFPKIHAHQHMFDDIRREGVSRNFGARIDEALHGPSRAIYQRQTNFKNVAPQILKHEHRTMIGKRIRGQIKDLDELQRVDAQVPNEMDNMALGSKLPPVSFDQLEQQMKADLAAFHRFRLKFSEFFTSFLHTYEGQVPGGKPVNFKSLDEIVPFQFLKIFYQSLDDWSDEADFLRCNPNFHGRPRFDAALVSTATGKIFVQLIHIFEVSANGKVYPFALVRPLDAPVGVVSAKDKDLKLFSVRAKPLRQASEFIPVRSIIRGAVKRNQK
ncbi:hypothetical protein B0H12DRAFT_1069079 [Mycena haematopus]|nr:hypothetical protein B0H12DRAFT_1069079 [Mycena haematopus]